MQKDEAKKELDCFRRNLQHVKGHDHQKQGKQTLLAEIAGYITTTEEIALVLDKAITKFSVMKACIINDCSFVYFLGDSFVFFLDDSFVSFLDVRYNDHAIIAGQ